MNFKDCVIHVLQLLAGMDDCMDYSCKQKAECLHCSLLIVYTEHGQGQASFMWEKLACLMEVSVMEQKFPN